MKSLLPNSVASGVNRRKNHIVPTLQHSHDSTIQRFNDSTIQPRARAFSLIEIMVAVTLLSLIVIGLLAVFNHLQAALRAANNQTDIFEGARAANEFVGRDLAEMSPAGDFQNFNVFASDVSVQNLARPGGGIQTNVVQDFYFVERQNDMLTAVGYFLDQKASGVGTLYRFSTNGPWFGTSYSANYLSDWWSKFTNSSVADPRARRIADGVVHFQVHAYDELGRQYDSNWVRSVVGNTNLAPSYIGLLTNSISVQPAGFGFRGDFSPAYVELEIGMLEPQTTRQFNAIAAANPAGAQTFLQAQLGKMHLFRQRIPVRNHTQPPAF